MSERLFTPIFAVSSVKFLQKPRKVCSPVIIKKLLFRSYTNEPVLRSTQLVNTRRRMEMLLEGSTCDYEPDDYYETTEELLEPLLICHESMVSN